MWSHVGSPTPTICKGALLSASGTYPLLDLVMVPPVQLGGNCIGHRGLLACRRPTREDSARTIPQRLNRRLTEDKLVMSAGLVR